MGRPKRIIQTEYPYHISTRTNNRSFRFNKKKIIKIFAQVFDNAVKKYNVKIFHFVLMANHYHIILKIEEENLDRFFQYVNSRIAMKFNKITQRSGHLWGDRYKSTIVSTDEHYLRCIRYIYMNPVRAGIVKSPYNWENSTIHFHAFGKKVDVRVKEDEIFVILHGDINHNRNRYFDDFMNLFADENNHEIEYRYLLRKNILGNETFKKSLEEKLSNA